MEGLFSFQPGGSERVGADVAIECVRRGYRVLAFAFYGSDGPVRAELEANGVTCADLNYLNRTRFVRRFTYLYALLRFLRAAGVHAIHIHHSTSLILGAIPARCARVSRTVMTEHSLLELKTMPTYRRQARRYCRFADAITVVHPSLEPFFLNELGVPRTKLHCIPNGVRVHQLDTLQRLDLRRTLGVAEPDFLWMFAGRLETVKGLDGLLRAFTKAIAMGNSHFRLLLVGDGSERAALQGLAQSLGLSDRISFLGFRSDVPRLIGAADGFVMNSLSEGLPMVLLEAMAAQVPCIATAVGGIPELFSDGAGILVRPGDTDDLTRALCALAADSAQRHQIVAAAWRKVAATNDLERIVDEYLHLFGLPSHWPCDEKRTYGERA